MPLPITEHWCGIKYHECAVNVGEAFYAPQSESKIHIDGFTDPGLDKNRFSLGSLNNINRTEGTKNAEVLEMGEIANLALCLNWVLTMKPGF